MKVVILCGGQGTRLREETEFRPKPMVEIGGRPILWHIMKLYARHGFQDFVLCLGYRGNVIREYFLNYHAMNRDFTINLSRQAIAYHGSHSEEDFSVTLAETGENTMTGGRLKRAAKYLTDDLFLLTYGDGIADVNIRKLMEFHRAHGKMATVTVVRPVSRFGVVHLGENSHVEAFAEKPQSEGWISAGFFVFDRRAIDYIGGDDCILEREPLERLAKENQLVAYHHEGFFQAMDTYREYKQLNEIWDSGQAPWLSGVLEPASFSKDLVNLQNELKTAESTADSVIVTA
jgi:glucose-1-phosphate cytidylyltransferase